jgi:hypothetical protein
MDTLLEQGITYYTEESKVELEKVQIDGSIIEFDDCNIKIDNQYIDIINTESGEFNVQELDFKFRDDQFLTLNNQYRKVNSLEWKNETSYITMKPYPKLNNAKYYTIKYLITKNINSIGAAMKTFTIVFLILKKSGLPSARDLVKLLDQRIKQLSKCTKSIIDSILQSTTNFTIKTDVTTINRSYFLTDDPMLSRNDLMDLIKCNINKTTWLTSTKKNWRFTKSVSSNENDEIPQVYILNPVVQLLTDKGIIITVKDLPVIQNISYTYENDIKVDQKNTEVILKKFYKYKTG